MSAMLSRRCVLYHGKPGMCRKITCSTVIILCLRHPDMLLARKQLEEDVDVCIVILVGRVNLHLVDTVCAVVARIAAHGNEAAEIGIEVTPFDVWTSFAYVVDELESLEVFVRFAVQLKVCLEIRLVLTQAADVGACDDNDALVFRATACAVQLFVLVQSLQ